LRDFPNGQFVAEARAEIQKLNNPETPPHIVAQAKQEEQQLGLDRNGRLRVETQLSNLSFDPGAVDGDFDANTRRALRQFQRANSLPVTGFVSNNTGVLLLVSSILQ
jgi:peptidoglycan hydrolase-like protein with peptidoglycan-binding domain